MAMGKRIIEIHLASKRKPSQKEGNNELKVTFDGMNKKTVEILKIVKIKT